LWKISSDKTLYRKARSKSVTKALKRHLRDIDDAVFDDSFYQQITTAETSNVGIGKQITLQCQSDEVVGSKGESDDCVVHRASDLSEADSVEMDRICADSMHNANADGLQMTELNDSAASDTTELSDNESNIDTVTTRLTLVMKTCHRSSP